MTAPQTPDPRPRARRWIRAAAALALAAALAGCTPAETGLQRDTARQLQERVLSISQAAAANNHTAALKALDNLQAELTAAAANGQVSEERRRTIMTVITAVRADLTTAITATAAKEAAAKARADAAASAAAKAKAAAEASAAQNDSQPAVSAPGPLPAPEQGKSAAGRGKGKNG